MPPATTARLVRRVVKPVVFVLCGVPFAGLVRQAWTGDLGPNPVETITFTTGLWALGLLVASLSITPARRLLRFNQLILLRRLLGLYAFFYATLHLLTWAVFDHALAIDEMRADVWKRPYITLGMATFALMLPLALTSNAAMIRRLGRRWRTLHRLAYAAAVTAVLHFWWLVKADTTVPLRFAAAVAVLLGIRLVFAVSRRASLVA